MVSKRAHIYYNWFWMGLLTIYLIVQFRAWITALYLPFAVYWGALFPDTDLIRKEKFVEKTLYKNLMHRNWLTHSVVLTTLIWSLSLYFQEVWFALFVSYVNLGVGIHLLADCKIKPKKWRGGYTIKFFKWRGGVYGLNGTWSTVWLLGSFVASVVMLVITLMVVA